MISDAHQHTHKDYGGHYFKDENEATSYTENCIELGPIREDAKNKVGSFVGEVQHLSNSCPKSCKKMLALRHTQNEHGQSYLNGESASHQAVVDGFAII
jgi:hypothetical protein